MTKKPLISTGILKRDSLAGKVAIVTGGGGGIGFEAARALAWLGAQVVIAEIKDSGKEAAVKINQELGFGAALSIQADVGDEDSVRGLAHKISTAFGKADIILNNAAVAPLGAVGALPIETWDLSYGVNLRAPVLLAQQFLPGMLERDYGVFVGVTSEGLAYMAAYEALKAAQGHLVRTLDAELEGTGVAAFTIGPGMVPTETALKGLEELGRLYGKPLEEMQAITESHLISVEEAGTGFAAAIALASRFRGQEVSSKQALLAAGIPLPSGKGSGKKLLLHENEAKQALALCRAVRETLREQLRGWQRRSIFERQWMLRDFKKHAGIPVEQWLENLKALEKGLRDHPGQLEGLQPSLKRLAGYYGHLGELAKGYEKDREKLEENLKVIGGWQAEAKKLAAYVEGEDS